MKTFGVYEDIASRTGGEIYIGVVGPVRTGKSTFIKKFMQELVLPQVPGAKKKRYTDELPQSASGRTVMTTEPKFVPEEGAEIKVKDAVARVRLIDCVGFPVEGAGGFEEEGAPRLVKTPWNESPVPFQQAAEEGTRRVIRDHATIGILMTTDGSVAEIPRIAYEPAEERAAEELKAIGKPYVIVLNCREPAGAEELRTALEEKYGAPVLALNAETANAAALVVALERVLYEFPVTAVDTNGAGDCHTGVICAELCRGADLVRAVSLANAAAAIAVTRHGPATCPTRGEAEALIASADEGRR